MNTELQFKREQLAKNICIELNNFVDLKNTLKSVMSYIKELTGFESVSIRLQDDGDYPYFVSQGFDEAFIKEENSLCTKLNDTAVIENGRPKLDCLCGCVIRGNYDSRKPYYTMKGSYWTNNSSELRPYLEKEEINNNIRNYCNDCGYESVGLFPIKSREDIIGLIH